MRGRSPSAAALRGWPVDLPSVIMPKAFQGTMWSKPFAQKHQYTIYLFYCVDTCTAGSKAMASETIGASEKDSLCY